MDINIIKISLENDEDFSIFLKDHLSNCISILKHDGIIVFPTETLYGLGVDINNNNAIEKLIELKGRPKNMPIAVAVSNLRQAKEIAEISDFTLRLIKNCSPRPITYLVPVKEYTSPRLTGCSDLIGLRFPNNPVSKAILDKFGPITATSANMHGMDDPITIDIAIEQIGNNVDLYLDTGPCKYGSGSTVIDTTGNTIKIIRHGACSGEELEKCLKMLRSS